MITTNNFSKSPSLKFDTNNRRSNQNLLQPTANNNQQSNNKIKIVNKHSNPNRKNQQEQSTKKNLRNFGIVQG